MSKNMLDVFMEDTKNYLHLNNKQLVKIEDIFMQGKAIYILDECPPIDIIKKFPEFMGEFGLLLINNIWFLTVSNKKVCYIPTELNGSISNGFVQFFAHSHPDDGTTANLFPSFPDLVSSDAIDHKFYIISVYGITEVDITNAKELNFLDERFNIYIWNNHISYEEYMKNQFKIYMNFMEFIGCKLNIIPYENTKQISEILNSKQLLKHEFWNKTIGNTPYPGKKL